MVQCHIPFSNGGCMLYLEIITSLKRYFVPGLTCTKSIKTRKFHKKSHIRRHFSDIMQGVKYDSILNDVTLYLSIGIYWYWFITEQEPDYAWLLTCWALNNNGVLTMYSYGIWKVIYIYIIVMITVQILQTVRILIPNLMDAGFRCPTHG